LRDLPPGGKVDVTLLTGEQFTVVQQTKQQILEEKYPDLIGQPITLTEAADKYGVPRRTIEAWFNRSKYITPLDQNEYPFRFDEAEISYLVDIYRVRRAKRSKAPLLDDNGLPYQIQHPKLAEYRRRRRDT